MSVPQEWFREWFGSAYLDLYPHRDEDEAEAGVSLYLENAELSRGSPILDLACGAGRHLQRFRDAGMEAVGVDLSAVLLQGASGRPGLKGALIRADMRSIPCADQSFAGLVNFFTSFGYFFTPEEDRGVLKEMRRVLRPGAPFLVDYLNAERVKNELEPVSESVVNGRTVRQVRWLEDNQVVKRIEIEGGGTFHERVRLYSPAALTDLMASQGLSSITTFGDYGGSSFSDNSPRFILFGIAE